MSLVNISIEHGRSLDEARSQLRSAVVEVQGRFGMVIQRVEWSDDGSRARIFGKAFDIDLRVDPTHLHATGNLTILGPLAGPIGRGLKQILQRTFPKRLPGPSDTRK